MDLLLCILHGEFNNSKVDIIFICFFFYLTYQLIIYVTDEYLCGELRSNNNQESKYHIQAEDVFFSKEKDGVYRNGKIYRIKNDIETGKCISKELIRVNHAKVCYDTSNLEIRDLTK